MPPSAPITGACHYTLLFSCYTLMIFPIFCVISLFMMIHNPLYSKYVESSGLGEQSELTLVFKCVLRDTKLVYEEDC